MAWPYTKAEIIDMLVGKFGFEQDDRDHDYYVLDLDGRPAAYTYVSRGRRDRVTPNIAVSMARQMRLSGLQQFRDAVECPLSQEEYYDLLRSQRAASDSDDDVVELASPRHPLRWVWTWLGSSFGYIQDSCLFTFDGRHVGNLNPDEEIFGASGIYLGEIRSWSGLIVDVGKADALLTDAPFVAEASLAAINRWDDREPLPMPAGYAEFPGPEGI